MTRPLRLAEPAPPDALAAPTGDSVESWLAVLTGMIRANAGERASVRDELRGHLRDRVRDLMLAGANEHEATRHAISELGDAAALARRYQDAIGPSKGRRLMYGAIIGIVGISVGMSGVAVWNAAQPENPAPQAIIQLNPDSLPEGLLLETGKGPGKITIPSIPREKYPHLFIPEGRVPLNFERLVQPESSLRTRIFEPPVDEAWTLAETILIDLHAEMSLRGLADAMVKSGHGVQTRWDGFENVGLSPDEPLRISSKGQSVAAILRQINELRGESSNQTLALRQIGGMLVIGLEHEFDRREIVLATYDLSPLVARRGAGPDDQAVVESVIDGALGVITGLVFPDSWKENGGDLAEAHRFGAKLFIKAPKRFHAHIRWVLDELLAEPDNAAGAMKVETRDQVPMLGDVPLLYHLIAVSHSDAVRRGPMLIRVVDGKVELSAPGTRILADEVRLSPDGSWEAGSDAGAWIQSPP